MWPAAALLLLLALQAADYSAEGLKALEERKYPEAAALFAKAIEADPKDYSAHFHLALASTMMGRDAEAVQGFKKVLELKPGLYEAQLNLGMVLLKLKQPREALPYLQAAAEAKPKELRPALFLGDALAGCGDFPQAELRYRSALEIEPGSAAAEFGLARALARQNKLEEASGHFRKAAEIDASYRDGLLELAALHEAAKQPSEAIALYALFPDDPAARERMGELLLETGKPAGAIPHLEYAVSRSPTSANRLALATAYLRSNQPDKGVPLLARCVEEQPANLDLRMMYGRALRDQKKYPLAADEFYRVTQAKPDSVEAWSELAAMLILMEDHPRALTALDKVKELGGETAAHHFFRAIILDRYKQYKPALDSYEKFLAMSGGKYPNEEFKARQRIRIIQKELSRR